jgi:hypothetical protein
MKIHSVMHLGVAFVSLGAALMFARPAQAQITEFGPGPWGPASLLSNESLVSIATDYVVAPNYDSPHHTAGLAYCDQAGLAWNACSHEGDKAEYCTYGSFARGYMIATPRANRAQCPVPGQNGMYSVHSPDKAMCLIYLHCSDGGWYASSWLTAPSRCEAYCPMGLSADEVQVLTWITNTPF